MHDAVRTIYEFGPFRVDPLRRLLLSEGEPVSLTPKAFDTLLILIERPGNVMSKGELMDAVWGETAVEENNLTQQIAALRRTFGRDSRYIATVPGRGYSFSAPVRKLEIDQSAEFVLAERTRSFISIDFADDGQNETRWRDGRLGHMLAAAYVAVVCFLCILPHGSRGSDVHTIAVLSFRSVDGRDNAVGQGIRDTLRARLGSLDDVTVRPSSPNFTEQDVIDTGRAMDVDVVLAGSVQQDEERVRVAIELVDVAGRRILWGETFDRSRSDLFELQDSIAARVVAALNTRRSHGATL